MIRISIPMFSIDSYKLAFRLLDRGYIEVYSDFFTLILEKDTIK